MTVVGERSSRPAVAVLGTWDPFVVEHHAFVASLRSHAHESNCRAAAIMLDPAPSVIHFGPRSWPYYDDTATRIDLLRAAGVDTVALVTFRPEDLFRSAGDFFDLVCGDVPLAEFWLKPKQSVGFGPKGKVNSVLKQCLKRGIRLRNAVPGEGRSSSAAARGFLKTGELRKAAEIVGHPPTLRQPSSGTARMAWPAGRYVAVAGGERDRSMAIDLVSDADGMAVLTWPSPSIDALSFIAGPGDVADPRAHSTAH